MDWGSDTKDYLSFCNTDIGIKIAVRLLWTAREVDMFKLTSQKGSMLTVGRKSWIAMNETSTVKTENNQRCHFPTDTEDHHHHHHHHTQDTEENQT